MLRRILLHMFFLLIASYAVEVRAQPNIVVINLKGCLDADPETAELDSCPPGQASPWTSCPTGACETGRGITCKIGSQNINLDLWRHYTNAFYFNPPQVAPGASGKAAVEVDRTLCSFLRACPCKRLPSGANQCKMEEHVEEWLIKYERSNSVLCVGVGGAGGGGGTGGGGIETP